MESGVGRCTPSEGVGVGRGKQGNPSLPYLASGSLRILDIPCFLAASLHPCLHGHMTSSLCICLCVLSSFLGTLLMEFKAHSIYSMIVILRSYICEDPISK